MKYRQTPQLRSAIAPLLCLWAIGLASPRTFSEQHALPETVATVNGEAISAQMLELLGYSRRHLAPEADFPQSDGDAHNADELVKDLVITELLYQAARKHNIDREARVQTELELSTKTLLSQLYVMRFIDQLHFSEETLRQAYEKQRPQTAYQLRRYFFASQQAAQDFLDQSTADRENAVSTAGNAADAALHQESSAWVDGISLPSKLRGFVEGSQVGDYAATLSQEGGQWIVTQLGEKSERPKLPFTEARENIKSDLAHQRVAEHIKELARQSGIEVFLPGVSFHESWLEN